MSDQESLESQAPQTPSAPGASAAQGHDVGDSPGPAGLALNLPAFEGPLDLLLHLVRSNDMDILDIPIFEVARQYNAFLDTMRELDLEVAAEYLVMAATLAHIKSRMMLPPEPRDEGEEEDPRAELSRQLLDYERYKQAAEELATLESGRDLVFSRPGPPPAEFEGCVTIRANLSDLVGAFERVLDRLESTDRIEIIRREDFRVQDKMQEILESAGAGEGGSARTSFRALLALCRNRLERVVLFLALLELIRIGGASARQDQPRADIEIEIHADDLESP